MEPFHAVYGSEVLKIARFWQGAKGNRKKKSQGRHLTKLRYLVPLFEKACPELSRREGPGEIWQFKPSRG
jgi:hypothetical protein